MSDIVSDKWFNEEFSEEIGLCECEIRGGIMIDVHHKLWFGKREKEDFPSGKECGQDLGKAMKMRMPKGYTGAGVGGQGGVSNENSRSEEQHDTYSTHTHTHT